MPNNPSIRLLDLSRLISRAGRPMTGVDRVEFAYLEHLSDHGPLYGLVRTSLGYILLDPDGCRQLRDRLLDDNWDPPDRFSKMRNVPALRARAEATLRRICLARCLPIGLAGMLGRHLPGEISYINTGHTNFTKRVVAALNRNNARIAVFIHDTIPLDFPEYMRPESIEPFRAFLNRVVTHADVILCNSEQTAADIRRHAESPVPKLHAAHLGVRIPAPLKAVSGRWSTPYFVVLGTIEPRKNHSLLLDIWARNSVADLVICGNRGWENQQVFDRLDAGIPRVFELGDLSDSEVFGLIAGANGMLFPSFAEGYGLPPIEAAALDTPVICNDLPIYREVLGNIPVYANVSDRYLWESKITELASIDRRTYSVPTKFEAPEWSAHFNTVLTQI